MLSNLLERAKAAPGEPQGFGTLGDGEAAYVDLIETELMQIGTLNEENIQWKKVVEAASELLKTCNHIRAYHGAIFALRTQVSSDTVTRGFSLATQLCSQGWDKIHPTEKKYLRVKKKLMDDIIRQLTKSLEDVEKAERTVSKPCKAAAKATLKLLAGPAGDGLDFSALRDVFSGLSEKKAAAAPVSDTGTNSPIARELDARGRAELRRDIKSIADRISQQDPGADVAASLRGYAAWLEFRGETPSDGGRIEQQPMPANIEDDFKSGLSAPTDQLMQRLEDRLFTSPDWFRGQHIAWRLAESLGHLELSSAIKTRAQRRVAANPELKRLAYANGAPILADDLQVWCESDVKGPEIKSEGVVESAAVVDDVQELQQLLSESDQALAQAQSGREVFEARLLMLDALQNAGLGYQVKKIAGSMVQEFEEHSIRDWDPRIFEKIASFT